jgi:transcriptional regulator with XRE-family HTH domain
MPDPANTIAAQVEMYGEPLGARFGRILKIYGISQARLAAVIGLSPPMLSQLMSGQRAKISNPAVFGRIVRLEELAQSPVVRAGDASGVAALLDEVGASRPALSTVTTATADPAGPAETAARALAQLADAATLARAATAVADPVLRDALSRAAGLAPSRPLASDLQ